MTQTSDHWNERYKAGDAKLSWFEERPKRSLELIREAAPGKHASIIDVGGGASRLCDVLLEEGYCDLTVLDVSEVALNLAQTRLGPRARRIHWLTVDIAEWTPTRQWDVWHDRALFHFLTDEARQEAYLGALRRATAIGAHVIIAGFAPDGPERCSGLPVKRYGADMLQERLGEGFHLKHHAAETHVTPSGALQRFLYAVFQRR